MRFLPAWIAGGMLLSVGASAADTDGMDASEKLPPMVLPAGDGYPEHAQRKGIEGRVMLEFDITPDGRADSVRTLLDENGLAKDAVAYLKRIRFQTPGDWAATGALRHWRQGFVYCLYPGDQPGDFDPGIPILTIRGSRLPGAPVVHHPGPRVSTPCHR